MDTQTWQSEAACIGQTDLFFPTYERADSMQRAKDVCFTCPVRQKCLDAHLGERHGVFGGTTPLERKAMGGANNPLPEDFNFVDGYVVDEGVPEPAGFDTSFRFDPKTAEGKQTIRRLVKLYAEGMSMEKAAQEVGIPVNTAKNYIRKAGVNRSMSAARALQKKERDKVAEKAVALYTSGLGIKAVSDQVGVSKYTVRRMAIAAGVFRSPEEQKQVQKEQMRKALKRDLNPSAETLLIVKYIKDSEMNPTEIARTLNVDKYRVYNLRKSVQKGVY